MTVIDNTNVRLGDVLKEDFSRHCKLKIIASVFSIYGFGALQKELEKIESLQFIFSNPTFTKCDLGNGKTGQKREFFIPKHNREQKLYGNDFEIQLRNKLTQKAIAKECAEWIKQKVQFKSVKDIGKAPLNFTLTQKIEGDTAIYLNTNEFNPSGFGYKRSDSYFTAITLLTGTENTQYFLSTFNNLWHSLEDVEDVTDMLLEYISSVYKENSPEYIYFIILYNVFSEFLEDISEDILPNDKTGYQNSVIWNKLFDFQKDGVQGIISKMEKYNGCILTDSVGLGKTFSALAVIKYYELRNKTVLVLCPKKLSQNWMAHKGNLKTNILVKDRFNYDVLHHSDLTRKGGETNGIALNKVNWGNYDIVVIDESHNFRNDEAVKDHMTRYQKLMQDIIKAGVKTKVLMLSATPVNNRFNDLKNQLQLAYEGDSDAFKHALQINRNVDEVFRQAQKVFNKWEKLPTEERTADNILQQLDFDFFKLLDSVTIARSRKHIAKYYDMTKIGAFPNRNTPITRRPDLCKTTDRVTYDTIVEQLSQLLMSIYTPLAYLKPSWQAHYAEKYDTQLHEGTTKLSQQTRETGIKSLMTTLVLKRLESSVHAFRITLQHIENLYTQALSGIEAFKQNAKNNFDIDIIDGEDMLDSDTDTDTIHATGGKVKIELAHMDYLGWERDLQSDLSLVQGLLKDLSVITSENDTKLQDLMHMVTDKIENPINRQNKKVLIFSAFSDTAKYLYDNISTTLKQRYNLNSALLTGSEYKNNSGRTYDFEDILTIFSPKSKEKDKIYPNDSTEIDVIFATDCISEGQNLQDCDYLINYDIHWNPVRIVQRFGRIDRIGSPNGVIQLVNYWPNITLDKYINLKERVENKMVIADMTGSGDDNILTKEQNEASYRHDQLKRLQDEVVDLEDIKTGVSITDLGLNDFRMDLLHYMESNASIINAPKGMHAVMPPNPNKNIVPGVIFVMRNIHDTVNIEGVNRLHPYYMVYLNNDGQVLIPHDKPKDILDILRTNCKQYPNPHVGAYGIFNQNTDDGKNMGAYSDLLNTAIASIIDIQQQSDINSLFSGGETTALNTHIEGIKDFELIGFVVVQDGA